MEHRTTFYKGLANGLLTAALVVLALPLLAQVRHTDRMSKSFKVNSDVSVEIANKYGDIRFETWRKDSVRIEIDIEIEARSEYVMERTLKDITFDLSGTEYFITGKTIIGARRTNIVQQIDHLADVLVSGNSEVSIKYRVFLPTTATLEVTNRFGNIYLGSYSSDINIDLSHGDLFATDFSGKSDISVYFGNGKVNNIKHGKLDLEYADFRINKAQRLSLTSKQSDIDIREVADLKLNSRRDKFHIDRVEFLNGSSSFSDYYINEVTKSVDISTRYGVMHVEDVAPGFSGFTADSEHTDFHLRFGQTSSYAVDLTLHNVEFDYPLSQAKFETREAQTDPGTRWISGSVGTASSPIIKISARSCDVRFIQ